jgi:hypothetical protein
MMDATGAYHNPTTERAGAAKIAPPKKPRNEMTYEE